MTKILLPLRFVLGLLIVVPPLLLPYSIRTRYFHAMAFFFHLPYKFFGAVAGTLIRATDGK